MPPEIPTQFSFEVLVSHTFPGFFSALSVFMLLDVLSPDNLTSWAFGTLDGFVKVMGFIILLGTILGILIDGIQHSFERIFFEKWPGYIEGVETKAKVIYPFLKNDVRHYYYFKLVGKDAFNHLTDNYYRYAEFYGNIFISLIAFSFIAPFYFRDVLEIHRVWSFFFGCVVPLALACLCIWSSYNAFVKYHSHRIDMILGYLGLSKFIEVTPDPVLFSLDGVEKYKDRLQKLLRDVYNIDWAEKAEIKKDDKTISISNDKNSAEITIDEKEKKATLKIDGKDTHTLNVKLENGKVCCLSCSYIKAQLKELKLRGLEEEGLEKIKELKGEDLKNLLRRLKEFKAGKASVVQQDDVKIIFETNSLGRLFDKGEGKKEVPSKSKRGKATVWLKSDESGTATVTASSEGFISGKVDVEVKEAKKDKKKDRGGGNVR